MTEEGTAKEKRSWLTTRAPGQKHTPAELYVNRLDKIYQTYYPNLEEHRKYRWLNKLLNMYENGKLDKLLIMNVKVLAATLLIVEVIVQENMKFPYYKKNNVYVDPLKHYKIQPIIKSLHHSLITTAKTQREKIKETEHQSTKELADLIRYISLFNSYYNNKELNIFM